MSEICSGGPEEGATRHEGRSPAALGGADWLCLAAAPVFAIMALVTATVAGSAADPLCSAAHASSFGGMVPMYLLMSAFHLTPWLKLVSSRSSDRSNGP